MITSSVIHDVPLLGGKLQVIHTNSTEELYDDYDLDYDISGEASATFLHKIMDKDKIHDCITCVFNSDFELKVSAVTEEAYMATQAMLTQMGEETECHQIKSKLIGWISDKIDTHLYPST